MGYYGYGITGDDAILLAMVHDIRRFVPVAQFTITVKNELQVVPLPCDVQFLRFNDYPGLLQALQQCDVVVVGGGGVYNEYSTYRPEAFGTYVPDFNVFCARIPILARAYGKPCAIYAVGVEPLFTDPAREDVRAAFTLADIVTVRDYGSRDILRSLGIKRRIHVHADPAVRLATILKNGSREHEKTQRPTVAVSLRHWNRQSRWDSEASESWWEPHLAKALDSFHDRHNASFVFMPFQTSPELGQSGDDMPVLQRVRSCMRNQAAVDINPKTIDPTVAAQVISNSDLAICMRFHSAIMAISHAVPCVALDYSLKIQSVMTRARLGEYLIELRDDALGSMSAVLDRCYANRQTIRRHLETVAAGWDRRASRPAALLAQLTKTKVRPLSLEASALAHGIRNQFLSIVSLSQHTDERTLLEASIRWIIDYAKEYRVAADLLEKIVAIDPDYGNWNYLLAFCLHCLGSDTERALDLYNTALKKGAPDFWVLYNRADLYLLMGKPEEALRDALAATSIAPDHEGAATILQKARSLLGQVPSL